MADQREAGISWTDETWNPVVGCSIVSPACTNCYAMAMAARIERMSGGTGKQTHYAGTTRTVNGKPVWTGKLQLAPDAILTAPLRWKRPRRVFVNSMSDLFHEDMPEAWIDRVFAVMALSPQHTFQILTKRPDRMRAYINGHASRVPYLGRMPLERIHLEAAAHMEGDGGVMDALKDAGNIYSLYLDAPWPLANVWLGVTAEDQRRADERIPDLLATPAAVRFVSAEPLLGPICFTGVSADGMRTWNYLEGMTGTMCRQDGPDFDYGPKLDWVIVGGESGPGARPTHPDWLRSIRDQCAEAGVAFHFKQWGEWAPISNLGDGEADGLYRSNRIAGDGESQEHLDEFYGRTCRVPVATLGYGGATGLDAFYVVEGKGGMTFFKLGKRRAGRLLDGQIHDAFPASRAGG